jgi:dTDP-4-amino-4,6-dideoxygalactose transaminase
MSLNSGKIPVANPQSDLAHLRQDVIAAITRVIDSGTFVLGPQVETLEAKLARRLGVSGAVGVACGTDALALALIAVGVTPGDEVITVSHTAGATVAAIRMIGAVPVLVDIDPATYCLDPNMLGPALSPLTKAIVPVHLYGHPADLDAIGAFACKHDIPVVEDCAQAQEAMIGQRPVGGIGQAGCFSFYPTKNLGAIGDGGMVTSMHADLVQRVHRLRTYGWSEPQFAEMTSGRCSRLDELQAAILNVKLDHLAADVERRRAIARSYDAAFADLPLIRPIERLGCRHVYHLYVVRLDRRDALAQHLNRAGIGTGIHYPRAVHAQPGLVAAAHIPQPLEMTDTIVREILSLPLYPSMSRQDQDRVITGVRAFYGK